MALMYSFPSLEPFCCTMSSSNWCFLTCIQIPQEESQVVWYSHLFKNFPKLVVIPHSQRLWHSLSVSQFSCSVLSDSVTPWTAAHQASLSISSSQSFQTHVHCVGNAIQPFHPLSSPSLPAFNWHSQ